MTIGTRHCGLCGSDAHPDGGPITSNDTCPTCGTDVCGLHEGVDIYEPHDARQHRTDDWTGEIWFNDQNTLKRRRESRDKEERDRNLQRSHDTLTDPDDLDGGDD